MRVHTMTSRIEPLQAPFDSQVMHDFNVVMPEGMPPLGIFRTVAKNPRVLSRMVNGGLLDKGSISLAERELVILKVCGLCKAEYEWGVHVTAFAKKAGFNQDQIEDTLNAQANTALWSKNENLIIHMVTQLHYHQQIDDSLWSQLIKVYQEEQLIELVMLSGLYHAVSFVVNGFNIENESFAAKFPLNKKQ